MNQNSSLDFALVSSARRLQPLLPSNSSCDTSTKKQWPILFIVSSDDYKSLTDVDNLIDRLISLDDLNGISCAWIFDTQIDVENRWKDIYTDYIVCFVLKTFQSEHVPDMARKFTDGKPLDSFLFIHDVSGHPELISAPKVRPLNEISFCNTWNHSEQLTRHQVLAQSRNKSKFYFFARLQKNWKEAVFKISEKFRRAHRTFVLE